MYCISIYIHHHKLSPSTIIVISLHPSIPTVSINGWQQMMQRPELNPGGVLFLGHGDRGDIGQLEEVLAAGVIETGAADNDIIDSSSSSDGSSPLPPSPLNRVVAIFTEFPSNPLLTCPDLRLLSALSRRYGVLLVVDDTIASFANADLLHSDEGNMHADP